MISANIQKITQQIPPHVKLIAVSKTKPSSAILEAYQAGQRAFGENKVQEMVGKYEELPKDIEWHLIGHLQSNKVKYIAPFVHLIHSVDSLKLLEVINKEGVKNNRVINCLLQFYIAKEETKFGLDIDEAFAIIDSAAFKNMTNVCVCGVMGMASFTSNETIIRSEFATLKKYFETLKPLMTDAFTIQSFGMSSDYAIAISEGSNMIRVGSSIFGGR
jgi:PLP dependent protein